MTAHNRPGPPTLDVGIFLISLSILLVELLLTRIFSVGMFCHFSFLAVSLAMTGIGLGGLIVNLRPACFAATMSRGWVAHSLSGLL